MALWKSCDSYCIQVSYLILDSNSHFLTRLSPSEDKELSSILCVLAVLEPLKMTVTGTPQPCPPAFLCPVPKELSELKGKNLLLSFGLLRNIWTEQTMATLDSFCISLDSWLEDQTLKFHRLGLNFGFAHCNFQPGKATFFFSLFWP